MYNKVVLIGNCVRDIELRYAQSGTAIANTAIATSRKFTANGEKKEEVMFIDITFFGRSAEIANQYLRKGSKILVDGRINFDQWTDQNSNKRSKHSVIVENMQMLDTKNSQESQQPQQGYNPPPQAQQAYQAPAPQYEQQQADGSYKATPPPPQQMPAIDIDEDEIPF